ncbi:MAG: thioredoxin family protein [Verrucomicrobiaceae bacterium]
MNDSENISGHSLESASDSSLRKSNPFWRWFWLTFLVVSLGYAWYSFYVPSNEIAWADDVPTAQQLATESDKKVMMFFTAEWCVPCRIMKREVFADEEAMKEINAKVVPVMVYADDSGARELVDRYHVRGTPITIFTNPQGEVLDYAVGQVGKEEFLGMLDGLSSSN